MTIHRAKQSGFTLIEVLIAMMIMSGAILVVANAWSGNFVRVKNSRINNAMAQLLQRKMVEFELRYKGKSVDEIAESEDGDFGPAFPGYRWTMSSQAFEIPNLSSGLIAREGGADEMLLMVVQTMTEFIKQSVKEISVTVYFKNKRGKEVKNTVTTYFVDYKKELSVPGLGGGGAPTTGDSGVSSGGGK